MIYVGTTRGRVLKLISHDEVKPVLIEAMQVFDFNVPVTSLLVTSGGQLVVLSDTEVASVAAARCQSPLVANCGDCVALQDPYCAWSLPERRCVNATDNLSIDRHTVGRG